ncbi:MAG: DUF4276 family protein [Lautropia sp.]|nr:DUF4276 family protein [Lautropia sp.]
MHYLSLALYAEGPTDYRFLSPVLRRMCEDMCAAHVRGAVEVTEVWPLDHPEALRDAPREQRILAAARMAQGRWRLLFVHTDGDGDADRARRERVDPALVLLGAEMSGAGVGVVPVRETESWMLADGDALRTVFDTTLDDRGLGLPPAGLIEREREPKQLLSRCFDRARPGARGRRHSELDHLSRLGDEVNLAALRRLPSFRSLEADVHAALVALGVIG